MTTYTTLISAQQLQALQASEQPYMVFDCSFDLTDSALGQQQYLQSHIPHAVYADLNQHLSTHTTQATSGGRHPLPHRANFAAWLASIGFRNDMQAVVYDRQGCNYCGRLWWMLQWAGHANVAVLDGGLQTWLAQGGATAQGLEPSAQPSAFTLHESLRQLVSADDVLQGLSQATPPTIVDARAPARYRGEVEPLDPVAGHIPGALNRPFTANIAADGRFKPKELLRTEFEALLQTRDPAYVIHQCGSGVSALPNLIAMEIAGFPASQLFAGSWSEWCSDASRPVAKV